MAAFGALHRPPPVWSSAGGHQSFASRVLLLLTTLPLALAAFAFFLQWRGAVDDPASRWPVPDAQRFSWMVDIISSAKPVPALSASDCVKILGPNSSPSFPYYRDWKFDFDKNLKPKICITSSTSAGLEQIMPWLFYHKVLGVSQFLLFVEGKAAKPQVSAVLETIPGVKVIHRTRELEEKQAKSRIWNETWLAGFFFKPCNYELFVRQSLNMEMAIVIARNSGMEWIIHLDTDELVHPAGALDYSLTQLFADVPGNVNMVVFPNYESSPEGDDIKDPFSEVSMFKKNYDHLAKEIYFSMYKEATRSNPNYFLTYGNGKSAARIVDNLRPNGAHRWYNYKNKPKEIKLDEAAVLHYTYTKFSDLTSRRDRCGCKPTKEDVKRCFMLEFDRNAFIIASTTSEEEMLRWYNEHVVWNNKQLNLKLLRKGIFTRIYAPMAIIQSLRETGVLSSVIASAQKLYQSKINSTMETLQNNTSQLPDLMGTALRKVRLEGRGSQMTTRKIMEIAGDMESAVPPMSPPGLHDFSMET